ncbi:bifunctional transcriptional activator/DNA repair enzyme AdaA [Bacillus sp. JJ722]|uniref:bifunctional transcriptional activator/DNA repair enzyme AdaA n=1 Tax=Bacillus sp. JJ722 TaxID=3122973 RepID=UPI002FFFD4B4
MNLTDYDKWNAVKDCDESYDQKFLYGVKTTGIYCKPSCKSKTPLFDNIVFFDCKEQAVAFGLRPCKRCRPDLLSYEPTQELVQQVKQIYDIYYTDHNQLALEIKSINISQNHLIRLFTKTYDVTPIEYINTLRIKKAAELLIKSEMNVLNIATLSGFRSLSNFYLCFKRQIEMTPIEYRQTKLNKKVLPM